MDPGPWRFWQFLDSAFPTGGFAHSGGLEAARQHGELSGRAGLEGWIDAALVQVARGALPWVAAAHRAPELLADLDDRCDAFTTNHVANRGSRLQGRALWSAVERAFGAATTEGLPVPEFAHLAPVFGTLGARLGFAADETARGFVFVQLRGWIAAAVRLNIVGPMAGQAVQAAMAERAAAAATLGPAIPPEDAAQTAPMHDLWQGGQDRLYSRLFQT